jgi:hypothetical protein
MATLSLVALLAELAGHAAGQLVTDGGPTGTLGVCGALLGRVRERIEIRWRASAGHEGGDAGRKGTQGESE